MANLSQERREHMLKVLEQLLEAHQDDVGIVRTINEIARTLNEKKYGLVWETHSENVNSMLRENIPVLSEVENRKVEVDVSLPYNFLIEGDNLHALKILEKTYSGKIDVIYIDPPYNTGAKDWKYNNDYVDKTDAYKHSKWLSFMSERLNIAKHLLTDTGLICVTIDDYELPNLWLLMDDIFGDSNRLGTIAIRNNPKGRMNKAKVSQVHEYALIYRRSDKGGIQKLPVKPEDKSHKYVPDEYGNYYVKVNLRKQGVDSEGERKDGTLKERYFPIYYDPKTGEVSVDKPLEIVIYPIDTRGNKRIWRRDKEGVLELFKKNDLIIQETKGNYQIYYRFRGGLDGELPKSIWGDSKYSASEYGTKILSGLIGREKFPYPKSLYAVIDSIRMMSNNKDAIVLDFFAGSGTTGHAVMALNKEDGGHRRYILCTNNENNIAEEVTYQRLLNIQDELPHNLKYFKTDFVKKYNDEEYTLLEHIKPLIELKYACDLASSQFKIILTEDEFDEYMESGIDSNCRKLFITEEIMLSAEQEMELQAHQCEVVRIPRYYYQEEMIDFFFKK